MRESLVVENLQPFAGTPPWTATGVLTFAQMKALNSQLLQGSAGCGAWVLSMILRASVCIKQLRCMDWQ